MPESNALHNISVVEYMKRILKENCCCTRNCLITSRSALPPGNKMLFTKEISCSYFLHAVQCCFYSLQNSCTHTVILYRLI